MGSAASFGDVETPIMPHGFQLPASSFQLRARERVLFSLPLARYAARDESFVLVAGESHNGPGAPRARPPERSGHGAPASDGDGGSGPPTRSGFGEVSPERGPTGDRAKADGAKPRSSQDPYAESWSG
jgi:hypothetical protein